MLFALLNSSKYGNLNYIAFVTYYKLSNRYLINIHSSITNRIKKCHLIKLF